MLPLGGLGLKTATRMLATVTSLPACPADSRHARSGSMKSLKSPCLFFLYLPRYTHTHAVGLTNTPT